MYLEINNVIFHYNSAFSLNNITLKVISGELFGIIGANGSGKSTLLHCINNGLKPNKGTVFIDSRDISRLRRKEIGQLIGTVPQQASVTYPYTVFQAVLMGREPHLNNFSMESSNDYDITINAMDISGVRHLANRNITELSGGELQRVIIARTLAQNPQILLLDEPTLHLDISHQLEILDLIKDLTKQKGLITVLVSHDMNIAARYCDKIVILNRGEIAATGTPHEIFKPNLIRDIFHVEAEVKEHDITGSLNIVMLSPVKPNGSNNKTAYKTPK